MLAASLVLITKVCQPHERLTVQSATFQSAGMLVASLACIAAMLYTMSTAQCLQHAGTIPRLFEKLTVCSDACEAVMHSDLDACMKLQAAPFARQELEGGVSLVCSIDQGGAPASSP